MRNLREVSFESLVFSTVVGHLVAAEPGGQHGGEADHQLAQLLAAVGGGDHHVLHRDDGNYWRGQDME